MDEVHARFYPNIHNTRLTFEVSNVMGGGMEVEKIENKAKLSPAYSQLELGLSLANTHNIPMISHLK